MPIPSGSNVQVTYFYHHADQTLMNVTNWYVSDGGTLSEMSELQAICDWFSDVGNPLRPAARTVAVIPESCVLARVRAQITSPTRTAFRENLVNQMGSETASIQPDTDVVITKRTDKSGRSRQGNFFLPGVPSDKAAAGILNAPFMTDVGNKMAWLNLTQTLGVGAPILFPVIFHRGGGGSDVITNIVVQPEVRVMTRRTVGRGI